ncbi:hypothetical protein [Paraburkholderia acidisoli]|uniref:Uncharacterized protein n=1 Tax=Paraburkholderia acidisoli TaxID=2571748 RepID=A0A7Z2JKZ7_9BURK|nr:hypothetical protein [Paraburkholderia acidisoli]QGZ67010.1 hypothetical protein FAZ98_34830 [Paraburkholderia acidisoli]
MEIITIRIEFPGGLAITDGATWDADSGVVHVSERLKQLCRELDVTEAPPVVSATCRGRTIEAEVLPGGDFRLTSHELPPCESEGFFAELVELVRRPSKDQRQQFGRFAHTLSAGATIGGFGFWHSTNVWTVQNALSLVNLCAAAVVLFYIGIISMDGE